LIPLMEREHTQRAAITSLEKIGPRAKKAIPHLIQHLEPEPNYIFHAALNALVEMGDAAEPAIDRLLELMESDNLKVRWIVMETLSQIPVSAERVLPKLRTLLKEETDDRTKYRVLNAIESYQAKEMIPDLIAQLKK